MAYAILRTRKMTTAGQMAGMQRHNDRTNNVRNADADLTHMNDTWSKYGTKDLRQDVDKHIQHKGVNLRKNSVKAIEHLFTFSPDFNKLSKRQQENGKWVLTGPKDNSDQIMGFFRDSVDWLKKRYGEDNLVHYSVHYDEKTPHMHAYVVPVKEKQIKWKNKNGEGVKNVASLCARDYLGGKDKMQQMQDSYYQAVAKYGLERGQKGSLAKHEHIQKYYARVNQANSIEQDMGNFTLAKSDYEVEKPSLIGRDEYVERQSQLIQEEIAREKMQLLEDLTRKYSEDIAKSLETKKLESNLRAEIASISNDLSKEKDRAVSIGLKQQKALEALEKAQENFKKLDALAKGALKQDPKAVQILMNRYDPPEKKKGISR